MATHFQANGARSHRPNDSSLSQRRNSPFAPQAYPAKGFGTWMTHCSVPRSAKSATEAQMGGGIRCAPTAGSRTVDRR
jgi:hypothetical protein